MLEFDNIKVLFVSATIIFKVEKPKGCVSLLDKSKEVWPCQIGLKDVNSCCQVPDVIAHRVW